MNREQTVLSARGRVGTFVILGAVGAFALGLGACSSGSTATATAGTPSTTAAPAKSDTTQKASGDKGGSDGRGSDKKGGDKPAPDKRTSTTSGGEGQDEGGGSSGDDGPGGDPSGGGEGTLNAEQINQEWERLARGENVPSQIVTCVSDYVRSNVRQPLTRSDAEVLVVKGIEECGQKYGGGSGGGGGGVHITVSIPPVSVA